MLLPLISSLLIDISASWARMLAALAISFAVALLVGIWAGRSDRVGRVILPIVDILQTLPILAFFPIMVVAMVPVLGINAAVVFLIVTSMLWNMIFAVYESIKTLPDEFLEISKLYKLSLLQRLRRIYIPASMPRLVEQSALSWAIGLFYLVTSEIFSMGSSVYEVQHGIAVDLTQLALSGNTLYYVLGIIVFVVFVVATRFLLFAPLEYYFNRHNRRILGKKLPRRLHTTAMRRVRVFMAVETLFKRAGKDVARAERTARGRRAPARARPTNRPRPVGMGLLVAVVAISAVLLWTNPVLMGYEAMTITALAATFIRVWFAFLAVLLVAVPLCVYIIFLGRNLGRYVTLFQIIASIPATIVLPVIVSLYSGMPQQGNLVALTIFFFSGIWYVVFSSLADSKALPENLGEIKRLFHIRGLTAWKKIYIKAIAPGLVTGAVTGIAAMWNASIVAEYFTNAGVSGTTVVSSVSLGIGKLLDVSLAGNNIALMALALINLTVMIILINTFVWKRLYRKMSDVYK